MTGTIAERGLPEPFLKREQKENDRIVLKALGRCGGEASFGDINGETFQLSYGQVASALDRLVERGVLDKRTDPDDGRRTLYRVANDLGGGQR